MKIVRNTFLRATVLGAIVSMGATAVLAQDETEIRVSASRRAIGAPGIRVMVNGREIDFDAVEPREVNGRVLVPLRGVLESMAATVEWDGENQTVIATKGDKVIKLPIGSRFATINNERVSLDTPAMTIAGTTMVPLRFLSESLGADVLWNPNTATVRIDTDNVSADNSGVIQYRGSNAYRRIRNRVVRMPEVYFVTTDLDRNWLGAGDTITVTMHATAGGRGWFRIRGLVGELKMQEEEPGVYVGTWTSDLDNGIRINPNDILAFVLIGDRATAEHHP